MPKKKILIKILKENDRDRRIQPHAPSYDPLEQRRWEDEQERKKKKKKDKDVPRGSSDIDYSFEEGLNEVGLPLPGLEHIGPQEVTDILQAAAKFTSIWVPLMGAGGIAVIMYNAFEYLKNNTNSSEEEAVKAAAHQIKQAKEAEAGDNSGSELKEISQATQWVDIERGKAQPPGAYDAGAKRLATLVDKKMVNALKTVRQHWPNLGDVKRLEAYAKSEFADEESKNAISILSSLGKHVNEWCPECVHKRATSELPSDAQDVPMPGNLEERKRRRLKKKRSK